MKMNHQQLVNYIGHVPLNFLVAVLILTHAFAAIPSPTDPCTPFDSIARSNAVWLSALRVMCEHFSVVCIQVLGFFRDALTASCEHFPVAAVSCSIPAKKNNFCLKKKQI